MSVDVIFFLLLAVVAIASALGMLLSQNAVYSALFLIMNFAVVAVFYLILGAPFIAMAQVTVYAGAIMVLFLFVIMLLGAERLQQPAQISWQRPVAIVLGMILLVEAAYALLFKVPAAAYQVQPAGEFATPTNIGLGLFNEYLLPFEVTSVLLLVAMVGAIVLTRRKT
jgi:NADH-quinone oxidoreductase subunit J